jgi:predicted RNA-binding protein YlxR (DUF448 family)
MPEKALIRFVAGPGGLVTPDVARRLPGRGMWVAARRDAVDQAARRGAFARSAKAKLIAPPDLADQVERLLHRRLLDGLGLARRAGDLTYGFDKVEAAIMAGRVAWLIEASDAAADGRRKLGQAVDRIHRERCAAPRRIGVFSGEELSLVLGLGNVIHAAFLVGRAAKSWTEDVERLAGFRPLLPKNWREGP